MKKYTCPSLEFISIEANEAVAYENPLETAVVTTSGGKITTTYNMALLAEGSQIQFLLRLVKARKNIERRGNFYDSRAFFYGLKNNAE